ncbi:hypothetical protein JCM10369A_19980 [Nocardioides pyridinolyticus]
MRLRRTPAPELSGLERRLIHGIETTVARIDGAEYFVPDYGRHRPVARRILEGRLVSPGLHRFVGRLLLDRPGSIVHAGTFFGDMLPSFSAKTPGLVYAFEPVLENYLLAREVVEVNRLGNVVLLHAGLGARLQVATVGVARAPKGRHHGGAARILTPASRPHARTQLTALLSIDQLAIDDLTLVQLDTEGFELPILQGAEATLRAQRPVVVVEDNRGRCGAFLAGLGYAVVRRLGRDTVYAVEAETSPSPDRPLRSTAGA